MAAILTRPDATAARRRWRCGTIRSVKASELFVSEFGSGRPILCLHGIEAHGARFLGLAARVPGLRVVAPDLRGHGRSPKTGPWTLEQGVADLTPLLATL